MTDQREHARYSASSYYRWSVCAGSPAQIDKAPPVPSSPEAEEGTRAHSLLAWALVVGVRDLKASMAAVVISEPYKALHEHQRTDAINGVQVCLDHVYEILDDNPDAVLHIEQRVHLPTVNAPDDCWGTADILIWIPMWGRLHNIDYKHGVGVVVEASSPQLSIYAAASMFGLTGHVIREVRQTIVQPRAFHPDGSVRHHDIHPLDLILFVAEVDEAIWRCENKPTLVPGREQCRWCPAAQTATCPALMNTSLSVTGLPDIKLVSTQTLPDVSHLGVDRIAYILGAKDLLESWLKQVEQYAFTLAKQGVPIPGHKLVETSVRRQYAGEEHEIADQIELLTGLPIDQTFPRQLLGITDMEKLFVEAFKAAAPHGKKTEAAQKAKEAFAWFTTKTGSGKLTLAPLSDRRPAVALGADFTGVNLPVITAVSN